MRKYLLTFLQVKYELVHTDECQFSFNHVFWKNGSLNLKRTHTVFSDYKHQLSINSFVCLQEFKQCLSGQLQRKIINNKFLLLVAIICLSASFQGHPASKLSECINASGEVDVVNNVSPAPSRGCAVYMEKK